MDSGRQPLRLPESGADEHDFWRLGQKRFEHLARAIHGVQPDIFGDSLYGPDGQSQFGADHVAHRRGTSVLELEVGQSKAYRTFSATQVRKAASDFLDHWAAHWGEKNVRRFILFVGCAIKSRSAHDEVLTQTARFAELGVEFIVWDANAIYDKLADAPAVVRGHLGQDWYERLFGEQVGPLTGLQKDLQLGDFGAASVVAYVGQLNQAQSAQIEDLKRRIRRGEIDEARLTLERTLFQSAAAAASAPETRAGMLRLLAGLLIRGRLFERAKQLLDEADSLDGTSSIRPRAILTLDAIGPDAALAQMEGVAGPEVAEVRAIAHLRLSQPDQAIRDLVTFDTVDASAETLRLLALATLLTGDRDGAVALARKGISHDSDSRACWQMLGICLFHRALSPVVETAVGEWPHPVDLPMVYEADTAAADLTEAATLFSDLADRPGTRDQRSMNLWALGTLACLPQRRADAELLLSQLLAPGSFSPPALVWAMARGMDFDRAAAANELDALLAESPHDLEARLVRIALANHSGEINIAKRVLEAGKPFFEAADEDSTYLYWSAVLDVEKDREPSEEALSAYPWLGFRAAIRKRPRKKRLLAIEKVAKKAAEPGGDRRVLLAALQHLLDGGWHNTAAEFADILTHEIRTAEAISVAAHALYLAKRPAQALEALEYRAAFPNGKLPIDLERLRVASLAAAGELLEATRESRRIAENTQSPRDIWQSINLQMAVGAVPAALAIYERHADKLTDPHPGHLHLANLALHHDRDAAIRITRKVAESAPDDMVTATYALAAKLDLTDEQRVLFGRIHELGSRGAEGVQMMSGIEPIIDMMKKRRAAADEAYEKYKRGHIPVHVLARSNPGALAETYLGWLLVPPLPDTNPAALFARYGRRFDAPWPEDPKQVLLIADVTALLTAQGLDILDAIERTFRPIKVGTDIQNALAEIRASLEPLQPARVEGARAVLKLIEGGRIGYQSAKPEVDPFNVLWNLEGAEPKSTLNLSRLIASMKIKDKTALEGLSEAIADAPRGPNPPKGSRIDLEGGMAVTLSEVGVLPRLLDLFRPAISEEEAQALRAEVTAADKRATVVSSLSKLASRLTAGIEDGTYCFAPPTSEHDDPVGRSFFQVLSSAAQEGSVLWVDDRFSSSFENAQFRTATTAELLGALVKYGRMDTIAQFEGRQRLRRARWLFLDVESDEIVHHLRNAVTGGTVTETEDLAVLRRAVAAANVDRRQIQFPDAEGARKGVRGEVPFLLDGGHTAAQVLRDLWTDEAVTIEDASAASSWVIEYLDSELMPLSVIPTGDPRSDLMVTLHLAQLVMVGVQFIPPKAKRERLAAYFHWLWTDVVDPRLRVRPEMEEPFQAALEHYLLDLGNDSPTLRDLWLHLAGSMINLLPKPTRARLMQRPKIRAAFKNPDHGSISIDDLDFDEIDFWKATSGAVLGKSITLNTARGKKATLTLLRSEEERVTQFRLKLGRREMRIDSWPWRVATPKASVRRAAIYEKANLLDMAETELYALSAEVGKLRPPWKRPKEVMGRAGRTMMSWYADLESVLEHRKPFKASDLVPASLPAMLLHFRLADQVAAGAERLLRDRGLALAARRWSGLPVAPPASLLGAANTAPAKGIAELLDVVKGDQEPIWTKIFVIRLLWERSRSDEGLRERLIPLLLEAASTEEAVKQWRLYGSIAHFLASELHRLEGWNELAGAHQLAVIWGHAGELARRFLSAGVEPASMARWFETARLVSPRLLVQSAPAFAGDFAVPSHVSAARLALYSAAPPLLEIASESELGPKAIEALDAMLIVRTPEGALPRFEVMQAGLCSTDFLGSYLAADVGQMAKTLFPGIEVISGEGIRSILRNSLSEPTDSRAFRVVWPHLRAMTGDGPIDPSLSDLARRRAKELDLANREDGLRHALEVLLAVASLADLNGWFELAPAIDAASIALSADHAALDDESSKSLSLLLEAAFWRARLEKNQDARVEILAKDLERFGQIPQLRMAAEGAAAHFAVGLSGQEAAPFIDALARFRSSR